MAGDISTVWAVTNGDWALVRNGVAAPLLKSGDDLTTGILVSLFSDRQANTDDEIADGSGDPRGWWGDPGLGSRLWLLGRAKLTPAIASAAIDYAKEAVQWLIDDGVVSSFDITTEIVLPSRLAMQIIAHRPDGSRLVQKFAWVWSAVN